jgi:putative ABC transport system permease protein
MNHAGVLLRLALRNVARQRRRSVLISLAMMLGVALLIIFLALGDGEHSKWIDAGVRLGDGYATIESPEYRRTASLDDRLDTSTFEASWRTLGDPHVSQLVTVAAPHLTVSALASSATAALPIRVSGVDPVIETRYSALPPKITDGRFLTPDDRLGAVIGTGLAERLGLSLGSRFVLTAQGASGEVQEQLARVVGIFRTGIREVDEGVVDIPLETARTWLAVPGAATSIAMLVRDERDVDPLVALLAPLLPNGAQLISWRETSPELDAAVKVDNFGNYLFNGILLAIVALAVLEALLVSVLHRQREFGVLRAMGLSAGETSRVVLAEGMTIALFSGLAGMAVGLGVTWLLGRHGLDLTKFIGDNISISGAVIDPVFYPAVRLARAWQGLVVVFVLGIVSSLYPMWHAARIDVATAMQSEQ